MDNEFAEQFEALLEKYSELLVGEASEAVREKVRMWALYMHISKTMPALTKHWNSLYPDAKEEMMQIIHEVKQLNEAYRNSLKNK